LKQRKSTCSGEEVDDQLLHDEKINISEEKIIMNPTTPESPFSESFNHPSSTTRIKLKIPVSLKYVSSTSNEENYSVEDSVDDLDFRLETIWNDSTEQDKLSDEFNLKVQSLTTVYATDPVTDVYPLMNEGWFGERICKNYDFIEKRNYPEWCTIIEELTDS